jgi:hypothetical protein
MVMNLIKTIMYMLCAGYESNKLDYVLHILIMGIMAIIDDYGMIMGSCYVSVFPYFFSWLRISLNILCMSYVLVMKMSKLNYVLHGNYELLWSNYGHDRPLLMIMKLFSKKHIIQT